MLAQKSQNETGYIKQNRIVSLDKLTAHPRNYRQHPEAQVSKLVSSLVRFGQGRSIVVQDGPQGYLIVAGHGIVEAAKKLGYTELRADIIPANWTPEQVEGYLIADNFHSQTARDDKSLLAELLQEQRNAGFDLGSLGFDEESLQHLLEGLDNVALGGDEDTESDDDHFDEEVDREQTRVKPGDIWKLGRHIIACLSSTDRETYRKLLRNVDVSFVWADPPYGISIVKKDGRIGGKDLSAAKKNFGGSFEKTRVNTYAPVIGDDSTETAISSFELCRAHYPKALQIWWGANHYSDGLPSSSCWLVWDKENDETSFADAELAWCSHKGAVRIFRHKWNGMRRDSEQGIKRVHPNQKPIKMAEHFFEKYGAESDIIFDPFLGSGISVIAAEKMSGKRTVIGCELSPEYINTILSRWEKLTGEQATLLERREEAADVSTQATD